MKINHSFLILFLFGMLTAAHSGSVNTSNERLFIHQKTLSVHSATVPDAPSQQQIFQRKESQPFSRTGTVPTGIVQSAVIFPPAVIRYVSSDETVIRFSIRIFNRYLPRDPTA